MHLKSWLAALVAAFFSIGVSAQKAIDENLSNLRSAGFSDVRTLSFVQTKKRHALTALYPDTGDRAAHLYFAMISSDKDGASMGFKTDRPCAVNSTVRPLAQRIIAVNGQKIETYYMCSANPDEPGTVEVFLIKSAGGNDFVNKEFALNEYVMVRLNDLSVPFKTKGYSETLAQSAGQAL